MWKLWLFLHARLHRIFGQATFLLCLKPWDFSLLFLSSSLPVCHSICLPQCFIRVPQLMWNCADVISLALLEHLITNRPRLGVWANQILDSMTEAIAVRGWRTFSMNPILFSSNMRRNSVRTVVVIKKKKNLLRDVGTSLCGKVCAN